MMDTNVAFYFAIKRCEKLKCVIESYESSHHRHDNLHRSEMGAWRRLMFDAGVPKHELPEMPWVNPEYVTSFKKRMEDKKTATAKEYRLAVNAS